MIGILFWILNLGILWRVPEFKFLAFFILANNAFYTLFLVPGIVAGSVDWQQFLFSTASADLVFAAIASPLILFRKWQKAPRKESVDKEMERIRAEIAARKAQPPAAP